MFTGIINGVGRVVEAGAGQLAIQHETTASRLAIGGSVAVNGCCLTVTGRDGPTFLADLVPETLSRTNLGQLRPESEVNLELPLTLEQGLDGHLVQGHVDATARVCAVEQAGGGRDLTVDLPAALAAFVAEKGSIAIDGTSLTVASVDDHRQTFRVALIPHTLQVTIASQYRPGTIVNLEVDLVARYTERLLRRSIK